MKSCQPALGPDWRRPNEVAPSIWPGREPKRTAAERPSSFSAFESEKPRCLGDCLAGPQSVTPGRGALRHAAGTWLGPTIVPGVRHAALDHEVTRL